MPTERGAKVAKYLSDPSKARPVAGFCKVCGEAMRPANSSGICEKCDWAIISHLDKATPNGPPPVPENRKGPPIRHQAAPPAAAPKPAMPTHGVSFKVLFAVAKAVALGMAVLVLVVGFMVAKTVFQEIEMIALACFFGIVARIFQAEELARKE